MISLILQSVITLFFIIFIGYVLGKKNLFSTQVNKTLTSLLINLFMPCFIFSNTVKISFSSTTEIFKACLAGYGNYTITLIISSIFIFLIKNFIKFKKVEQRSFIFSISLQNYGYLPIPLALSLFPNDGELIALLFIHNSFVELAIWTVGIIFLTKSFNKNLWKKFLNAPFITIIISILISYFKIPIPKFFFDTTKMIGNIAIPVALLIVGATFAHLKVKKNINTKKSKLVKYNLRFYIAAITLRNFLLPLLILSSSYFLFASPTLTKVLILEAAMPAALFPIVICKYYNKSPHIATKIAIITSLFGFITIPLIISLGLKLLV